MLSALLTVGVLLFAGHLAQRTRRFPEATADVLHRFVIDLCLPATILRLVPKLHFEPGLSLLVVTPWVIAGLAFVVARWTNKVFHLDKATTTAFFLVTALGNTSFLGFPLIGALVGEEAVPLAAVYDQLGSFLLLSLIAPAAIGAATTGRRPTLSELLRRVVLFPPFLALLLALAPLPLPEFVQPLLLATSTSLVPIAMFAVGFKLRIAPPHPVGLFAWGLFLKLIVFPAASLGLCLALGAPREVLVVAVLETGMPTMISAGALLMAYEIRSELVAAFVGWGLLASLVTVPTWAFLLR